MPKYHKFIVTWPRAGDPNEVLTQEELMAGFMENIAQAFEGQPGPYTILEINKTAVMTDTYSVKILCSLETAKNILDYEIDIGPSADSDVEGWMGIEPMTVTELVSVLTTMMTTGQIKPDHEVFIQSEGGEDLREALVKVDVGEKNSIILQGEL